MCECAGGVSVSGAVTSVSGVSVSADGLVSCGASEYNTRRVSLKAPLRSPLQCQSRRDPRKTLLLRRWRRDTCLWSDMQ